MVLQKMWKVKCTKCGIKNTVNGGRRRRGAGAVLFHMFTDEALCFAEESRL